MRLLVRLVPLLILPLRSIITGISLAFAFNPVSGLDLQHFSFGEHSVTFVLNGPAHRPRARERQHGGYAGDRAGRGRQLSAPRRAVTRVAPGDATDQPSQGCVCVSE